MDTHSESESDYDSEDSTLAFCERCCLPPNYFHHVSPHLGWRSEYMTCPSCRSVVQTRVVRQSTPRTWAISAALAPLGCCWLPWFRGWYCMLRHYCPVCEALIGLAPRTRAGLRDGGS